MSPLIAGAVALADLLVDGPGGGFVGRAELLEVVVELRIGGTSTCWMPCRASSSALILAAAAAGRRSHACQQSCPGDSNMEAKTHTCSGSSIVRRNLSALGRPMAGWTAVPVVFGAARRRRARASIKARRLPVRLGLVKSRPLWAAFRVVHGGLKCHRSGWLFK